MLLMKGVSQSSLTLLSLLPRENTVFIPFALPPWKDAAMRLHLRSRSEPSLDTEIYWCLYLGLSTLQSHEK
jgi:hypothetical protein